MLRQKNVIFFSGIGLDLEKYCTKTYQATYCTRCARFEPVHVLITDLCTVVRPRPVGYRLGEVLGVVQGSFTYGDREASVGGSHTAEKLHEVHPPVDQMSMYSKIRL